MVQSHHSPHVERKYEPFLCFLHGSKYDSNCTLLDCVVLSNQFIIPFIRKQHLVMFFTLPSLEFVDCPTMLGMGFVLHITLEWQKHIYKTNLSMYTWHPRSQVYVKRSISHFCYQHQSPLAQNRVPKRKTYLLHLDATNHG